MELTEDRPAPLPFGLSLGGGPLGNLFEAVDDDTAYATVEAAWENGIRYFDTAPHYGLGLSERRMGQVLSKKPRSEFRISTKVGRRLVERTARNAGTDTEGFDVPATHERVLDFTETGIRQSLEDSLTRLGLDAVDIVYLHDPEFALDEAIADGAPALERIRSDGLCRAIGVGSNVPDAIVALVERFDLDVAMVAGTLTLLDQSGIASVVPACAKHSVDIVAAGVFNSGILASDNPVHSKFAYADPTEEVVERVQLLAATCEAYETPLKAVAMAFPARYAAARSVCIGARTPHEVQTNTDVWGTSLPEELWQELEDIGLIDGAAASPLSTNSQELTKNREKRSPD